MLHFFGQIQCQQQINVQFCWYLKPLQYQVKFSHRWKFFSLFMLPVGGGFVVALPHWLFSSIFRSFVTALLSSKLFFFFIFYFVDKFEIFFTLTMQLVFSKIIESKTSLVYMQLNPLMRVLSNSSTILTCAGSETIAFDKYRCWGSLPRCVFEIYMEKLYGNFSHHFLCSIFKYFAEYDCILKIVYVIELGQLL